VRPALNDQGGFGLIEHEHIYEDEIDLRDLILTVWRGRWIIIGAVAVAVIVAFVYATFVRERVYEAEISVLPSEFRLADGRSLNPSDYLPIFHKDSVLDRIAAKYMPDHPDIDAAIDSMVSSIKVDIKTDRDQNASNPILTISMRHRDRATAMEMARDYIAIVQSELASLASQLNSEKLELLERDLKERTDELQAALDEQQSFRTTYDIETLRSRLSNRRSRLVSAEAQINDLESIIEVLAAQLERVRFQLGQTEPLLVTKDVLDETRVKLFRQITGDDGTPEIPYIDREHINPVYTQLLEMSLTAERQIESRKIELENATSEVAALRTEIDALLGEIADAERRDLELSLALSRARSLYDSAYSHYSSAVSTVKRQSYSLTIISGPWASTRPVGSGMLTTMVLAAVLAGFISVFGLLLADYMRGGERRTAQPPADAVARQV